MKNSFRLLLLTTVLLCALMCVACTGGNDKTPSGTEAETTAGQSESAAVIVADGTCDYTVVRSDDTNNALTMAIALWRTTFNETYGCNVKLNSDWDKSNKDNDTVKSDSSVHEILIGKTNREESRAQAESGLTAGYLIKFVNGKIVIYGTDDESTQRGMEYFFANFALEDGRLTIPENYSYVWSLTGEGSAINTLANEYTIIRADKSSDRVTAAASLLRSTLSEMSGVDVAISTDAAADSGREIIVGSTNRSVAQSFDDALTYMDYTIKITGDKVLILGGSPLATEQAVNVFIAELRAGRLAAIEADWQLDWLFKEKRPDSILWDPASFKPVWADSFTPPAWMLDFDEKIYAVVCPTGRIASDAHRGDTVNYPENSAEGIYSAALMGADCIEIDIRKTSDNVLVLMHDEKLSRTTNWSELKGKNGLPTSEYLCDWTYEQLLCLNLTLNSAVTEYKIPTLYEVLALCAGKCMIHFDCKIEGIDKNSDVFLLADEVGAKECFFYYYGRDTMNTWLSLDRSDESFKKFVTTINSYMVQPGFVLRNRNYDNIAKLGDNETGWKKSGEVGYMMVFTNKALEISKYISTLEPLKK